ncbi:MAG: hypothetical protein Q7J67_00205, partial [bacterium]|nr:hypothetical protein [bacterium]
MTIDWDGTRLAYNRDHKTNYKTRWMFLKQLYKKYKSLVAIQDIIYISASSIGKAMDEERLPKLPKGHQFPSANTQKIIDMDTRNKNRKEIAAEAGFTTLYRWMLQKK